MSAPPARRACRAAVEQLQLAVQWALLHPCDEDSYPAGWGWTTLNDDGVIPLAGPGTPLVDQFAPASLGAALGITLDAAKQLIADALELTYRLPRLWTLVVAGLVPVWLARTISRETHDLSVEAVAYADRLISATPDKVRQVNAARLVDEARLYFDPDRAVEDERRQLESAASGSTQVEHPATTEVFMTLDTPDAELFDQTIRRIAGELGALGDTDDLDIRRARAVGILADPQHALDLLSGRDDAAPTTSGGTTNLYVHLTPQDLDRHRRGVDREARRRHHRPPGRLAGPPLCCRRRESASDPSSTSPIDHRGRPARPTRRDARTGPPARQPLRLPRLPTRLPHLRPRPHHPLHPHGRGRTTRPDQPANLAPLCRTHHRIKTFTAWDYKRLDHDGNQGLRLDRTDRPPVRSHADLAPPTTTKNLTPRHPGPPQPGPPARPRARSGVESSPTKLNQPWPRTPWRLTPRCHRRPSASDLARVGARGRRGIRVAWKAW